MKFTLQDALKIPLHEYLSILGVKPEKMSGEQYLYKSPFRQGKRGGVERTASLSVNIYTHKFYDHGDTSGLSKGNIIDFVGLQYGFNPKDKQDFQKILYKIGKTWAGNSQLLLSPELKKQPLQNSLQSTVIQKKESNKIEIVKINDEITNFVLLSYLQKRKIPLELAKIYYKEIYYKVFEAQTKPYFSLGFKNDCGNYELSNPQAKTSTGKDITTIMFPNITGKVAIFEGDKDFISFLVLNKKHDLQMAIVLNSANIWQRAIKRLREIQAKEVFLYLDNDSIGNDTTNKFLGQVKQDEVSPEVWEAVLSLQELRAKITDERELYKKFKDFNELLMSDVFSKDSFLFSR